jgi:hypothetical protein
VGSALDDVTSIIHQAVPGMTSLGATALEEVVPLVRCPNTALVVSVRVVVDDAASTGGPCRVGRLADDRRSRPGIRGLHSFTFQLNLSRV